ncbi:class I SAM-dependent methyltransferase [Candidatus Woesearchaeota archaeon]|nr:class I SAM-dependent methyltransferase [Candidatus Woesearchaeota archaeon]
MTPARTDGWDRFAERYARMKKEYGWCAPQNLAEASGPFLARYARQSGGSDRPLLVDLGTGGGEALLELSNHLRLDDWQVIGVDIGARFLSQAKENVRPHIPGFGAVRTDLSGGFPFADGSVDAIVSSGLTGDYLEDIPYVLAETSRVLRPGGIAAINGHFLPDRIMGPLNTLPFSYRSLTRFTAYAIPDRRGPYGETLSISSRIAILYTQMVLMKGHPQKDL